MPSGSWRAMPRRHQGWPHLSELSGEPFDLAGVRAAAALIAPHVPPTPQYAWPLLARRAGCEIWVKHENHTPTGAFKVRGGLTYLDWLFGTGVTPAGLISATRGNHGQSLAFAARLHGLPVTILVPHGNAREKNAAMAAFGATVIEFGHDFEAARLEAVRRAAVEGLHLVPSFHPELVRGVATYALEFFAAAGELDAVYVPIGMGSGICAVIRVRDLLGLRTRVIGVVSDRADAVALSLERGVLTETASADTLADGMACRVPVQAALDVIGAGAARVVRVSDEAVAAAIRALHEDTHNLAEGAGAAGLAAVLSEPDAVAGKRIGIILCGGNIDRAVAARILAA